MWQKLIKKTIFTLAVDNWQPEICDLTFPLFKLFADKIGADFYPITERKNPEWPVTYEKMQIYQLAQEMQNDWNIYIDADALVHPEMIDVTTLINKDTVMHNGSDMAQVRWKMDRFFLRDGRKISSCFLEGTIISGGNNPIDELSEGSTVLDKNGLRQKVTHTFKRKYSGDIISLKAACIPEIKVTPEHPILVSSPIYKYPNKFNPVTGKRLSRQIEFSKPEWKKARDIKKGDFVISPRIKTEIIKNIKFDIINWGKLKHKVDIPIDTNIAWFLGLYVAEGFVSEKGEIHLSLNKNENKIASRSRKILSDLGLKTHIYTKKSVQTVWAYSPELAKLLNEICGKGALNKKVPRIILESPPDIIRSFIKGLIEGDGCFFTTKDGTKGHRLVSISRKLIFDMIALCHKIGVHVSAYNPRKNSGVIEGRVVDAKPVYELNIPYNSWIGKRDKQQCLQKGHARFTEDNIYLPIRKISTEKANNINVYNIETNDHTYSVPFIVHNCNWFTVASDWCIELWEPVTDMTPDEVINSCFPTVEESNTVIQNYHLIDDFILSRNIAKNGFKFVEFRKIMPDIGLGDAWLMWHAYTITPEKKLEEMKRILAEWKM